MDMETGRVVAQAGAVRLMRSTVPHRKSAHTVAPFPATFESQNLTNPPGGGTRGGSSGAVVLLRSLCRAGRVSQANRPWWWRPVGPGAGLEGFGRREAGGVRHGMRGRWGN